MKTPEFQSSLVCSIDDGTNDMEGGGGDAPHTSGEVSGEDGEEANAAADGKEKTSSPSEVASQSLDQRINKVVSTQLRRGYVQEMITDSVKAGMSELLEQQAKERSARDERAANEAAGGRTKDVDARIAHYEKRLREMENTLEAQQKATETERIKALRSEERSNLEHELRVAGVPDERLRGAVALLYLEDGRVQRNSSGEIIFRVQREGYVDELPLKEGVKEWIKSHEGKIYSPPRDAGGSGSTGGRAPGAKGKPTRSELMQELGGQLMTRGGR